MWYWMSVYGKSDDVIEDLDGLKLTMSTGLSCSKFADAPLIRSWDLSEATESDSSCLLLGCFESGETCSM